MWKLEVASVANLAETVSLKCLITIKQIFAMQRQEPGTSINLIQVIVDQSAAYSVQTCKGDITTVGNWRALKAKRGQTGRAQQIRCYKKPILCKCCLNILTHMQDTEFWNAAGLTVLQKHEPETSLNRLKRGCHQIVFNGQFQVNCLRVQELGCNFRCLVEMQGWEGHVLEGSVGKILG